MIASLKIKHTVLAMALAVAYPLQAFAASAGVAQFIAGDVNVRRPDGQTNPLAKGTDIESGQAIVTGASGRAQVKFSDGGLISLQPNTEFKIASYVDKADPQEDRFLVDLLRGSMRAITGLIGKRNRANYKVTTTTATIGIRGSGFSAGYNPDGSLGVTAEKDAIEVCSGGSCVGLVAGESVRVNSSTEAPVRTSNRATVPTPGPVQDVASTGNQTTSNGKSTLITNQTTSDGKSALISSQKTDVVVVTTPVIRTFTDVKVLGFGTTSGSDFSFTSGTGKTTTFSDNKLLSATGSLTTDKLSETGTPRAEADFGSSGNVYDANFIGWGTWTTGQYKSTATTLLDQVHYVAGRPTPQSKMITLMLSGSIANYSLIGSTAPTRNGVVGTLNSATLSVNFTSTSYTVTTSFNTSFGNITGTSGASNTPFFNGPVYVKGMFIGSSGDLIGLTYADYITSGYVVGAAAFRK